MKKQQSLLAVGACVLGLALSSVHADLIAEFTVTQSGHLLEGATVTSVTTDILAWDDYGYGGGWLSTGINTTTVTISGATGSGSVWNGSYEYSPVIGTYTTLFGNTSVPNIYSSLENTGHTPLFIDGSGNGVVFYLFSNSGSINPSVGSAVVQDNFGSVNYMFFASHTGSPNPGFANPGASGGTGSFTVTNIPEPASASLIALVCGGSVFIRRRLIL